VDANTGTNEQLSEPEPEPTPSRRSSPSPGGAPAAREIAEAWQRERPGTPTASIEVVTPIFRLAKLFADDRARVLREAGIDAATLDLLSTLRRTGQPYALSAGELARRALVTAGAISQRVARAERQGLVVRSAGGGPGRNVLVTMTSQGHELVERSVDIVLGREAQLVESLTQDERTALIAALDSLLTDVSARARL